MGIVGPPNAGKSTLFNLLVGQNISPVSNKQNTTSNQIQGYNTNIKENVQLVFYDTPGITKRYESSGHYITKAWDTLNSCDQVLFVIDSAKRIDERVKEALRRLNKLKTEPNFTKAIDKIELNSNNYKKLDHIDQILEEENSNVQQQEAFPKILILNKMDICTNKKKLKETLNEIEDLAKFEKIFHVSCETGYGLSELKEYLEKKAVPRMWNFGPNSHTILSNVDIIENIMIQSIYERYFKTIPYRTGVNLDGFSLRSDGVGILNFTLDVEGINEMKIIAGEKGRNLDILKEKVRVGLIKHYQRDFIIYINLKQRQNGLEAENSKIQDIVNENEGEEIIQQEIDLNKKNRQKTVMKLKAYLNQ